MTSKTISGSLTIGVTLSTATYNYNPLYVTGTINTAAGNGVYGDQTQAWTIENSGTIAAGAVNGVRLKGGGSVTNGAGGATAALISGFNDGVYIYAPGGTTGTITNFGTITGGDNGIGAFLSGAGVITNGAPTATAALISSGYIAVEIANLPGTVINFGTIIGTAGGGAVRLDAGVMVNGGSGSTAATVNGGIGVGVYNAGGSLTLTNYGRIIVDGSGGLPAVKLTTTGTTANSIINYGTIEANLATAIDLQKGGIITNAGGVISGAEGILVGDFAATITNAGTIIGSAGTAVAFGTASNRLIVEPSAVFQGIVIGGAGTLSSNTLELAAGAATGTIATLNTSFVNFGTLSIDAGASWAIGWANNGTGPQTVSNLGTLTSVGNLALYLPTGGSVSNGASGIIVGTRSGIGIKGAIGATVTNLGTIIGIGSYGQGDGIGIRLTAGAATVSNSGLIQGFGYGLDFNPGSGTFTASGIITNSGTIAATGPAGIGISFGTSSAASTLTNSGTIIGAGGTAVVFAAGNDRLILNPGAVFAGEVDGGGGTNALELVTGSGTGTITGIGIDFTNFSVLTVDAGARWTVTGSTIAAGVTLTDAGSLLNAGSIGTEATLTAGAYLANLAGGVIGVAGTAIKATGGAATVVNLGTVEAASGPGIYLAAGGSITNGSGSAASALIAGYDGIVVRGAPGTIGNYGTIIGSDIFGGAVSLDAGGSLTNFGTIAASGSQSYAVFLVDGSLTNAAGGLIAGGGKNGILLSGAGGVANFGTIAASNLSIGVGVSFSGGGSTLVNAGIISGASGTAVVFAGTGSNLLVLEQGYQLDGVVVGSSSASNTVELAGSVGAAVTASYAGLGLTNFQDLLFGAGGYDTLQVSNNSGTLPVTISGFTLTSDIIDLTGIGADGAITYSNTSTDRITVAGSLGGVTLQFDSIDGLVFTTGGDGASGSDLSIACFCRGTLILTEVGEVAVGDLAVGDRVVTHFGDVRTIRWIGRRAYDGRFVAGKKAVLPIRIAAGALADGVPTRDLWLSPEHSLYFDGVLAQAAHLVNGLTIVQSEAVERVEYFHVELDSHDILVADGAPAESYIDCDNRLMFENGAEFAALYPNEDRPRWQFCLPRLEPGSAELAAIRAALHTRAERLGHRLDLDPDLHLLVGGVMIGPEVADNCLYRFTVPVGATTVLLASRSTVPAETTTGTGDVRRLGVAIADLLLHDADVYIEAAHSHADLDKGFHPDEETHRWTDGLAQLPTNWLRCFAGTFTLEVRLASRDLAYPVPSSGPRAAAA